MRNFEKLLLVGVFFVSACTPSLKTTRVSVDKGDELGSTVTDEWVKKDTVIAVDEMIKKMGSHKGLQKYLNKASKVPVLFVGEVQNNTPEPYLPIKDFNDKLLSKLLENGDFRVVDNVKRGAILKELVYQNGGIVDPNQAKKIGKQTGADIAIFGSISMAPKTLEGRTVKEYSVNLRMTELETSDVIWMGSYDLSKYSKRSGSKW